MIETIIFDLDGTLTPSRSPMDEEMFALLKKLTCTIAIVSGAGIEQFNKQLPPNNFILFPTNATKMYINNKLIYEEDLPDKERIFNALSKVVDISLCEDRGSQITFSGLRGELDQKAKWDPTRSKRKLIVKKLKKLLPDLSISIGGTTSIDITTKDKYYCVTKLVEMGFDKYTMMFIGDAIFPDGNDYSMRHIRHVSVNGVENTKEVIREIIRDYPVRKSD